MRRLLIASYALLFALIVSANFILIPINVNLIVTCFLIITIGAYRSLEQVGGENAETMDQSDAMRFPITAGIVLCALFVLFQLFKKEYINMVITAYIFIVALLVLAGFFSEIIGSFASSKDSFLLKKRIDKKFRVPILSSYFATNDDDGSLHILLDTKELISLIPATSTAIWYILTKHWCANNFIGIAFSIQGIEAISFGSYRVAAGLLCALFFYDIYFVFGTSVMVTVAKNVDAPIKLLFPKSFGTVDSDPQFSMLGLGDIVLPGLFIALMLRFDASRAGIDILKRNEVKKQQEQKSGNETPKKDPLPDFPTTFFSANLFGYVCGLFATLYAMYEYKAAQPALLYLVPACLIASLLTAFATNSYKQMVDYNEEKPITIAKDKTQ